MKKFIICNWKMELTYNSAVDWIKTNKDELQELSEKVNLVICPSFTELQKICEITKDTNIAIGAQNSGAEIPGAFTGEVSSVSLKEIGCKFCIINHQERKFCETDDSIIKKIKILLENGITPVVCYDGDNKQLIKIIETYKQDKANQIIIAYEPIGAIGTGKIPDADQLQQIISQLKIYIESQFSNFIDIIILYGGSVRSDNIENLNKINGLSGFLIGKASLDFQELKKIVG